MHCIMRCIMHCIMQWPNSSKIIENYTKTANKVLCIMRENQARYAQQTLHNIFTGKIQEKPICA